MLTKLLRIFSSKIHAEFLHGSNEESHVSMLLFPKPRGNLPVRFAGGRGKKNSSKKEMLMGSLLEILCLGEMSHKLLGAETYTASPPGQ